MNYASEHAQSWYQSAGFLLSEGPSEARPTSGFLKSVDKKKN